MFLVATSEDAPSDVRAKDDFSPSEHLAVWKGFRKGFDLAKSKSESSIFSGI